MIGVATQKRCSIMLTMPMGSGQDVGKTSTDRDPLKEQPRFNGLEFSLCTCVKFFRGVCYYLANFFISTFSTLRAS